MDLQAALVIQEAVAVQPVEVPAYNIQVSRNGEKQGDMRGGKISGKEMKSMKRGAGEQEKESAKEEKVEEVHTGDTNNATSPQKPMDNERIIAPTTSP